MNYRPTTPAIWGCALDLMKRETMTIFAALCTKAGRRMNSTSTAISPVRGWCLSPKGRTISAGVLGQAWKRIYGEFLRQSVYRQLDVPAIEQYDQRDEAEDRCRVAIMIPVEKGENP